MRIMAAGRVAALGWILVLVQPAAGQMVRILDAQGNRNFLTLQAAIDAASDGEVLLVGAGSYTAFTLTGKGLTLMAAPGASVTVVSASNNHSTIHLTSGDVVVVGFTFAGAPPLTVSGCTGQVRFQDCKFVTTDAYMGILTVWNCTNALFVRCTMTGAESSYTGEPGSGAMSISGSSTALYECNLRAANGTWGDPVGGRGGSALGVGGWCFGRLTTITGGNGGASPYWGGDGGTGLSIGPGTHMETLQVQAIGGVGGSGGIQSGQPGAPIQNNGTYVRNTGSPRDASTLTIISDLLKFNVSFTSLAGDRCFLMRGSAPAFVYLQSALGLWTATHPVPTPMGWAPIRVGPGAALVSAPVLPPDVPARLDYLQPYAIATDGTLYAGGPRVQLVLNRDSGPDCNANGLQDYLEVILFPNTDSNKNLIPDACEGGTLYVDPNAAPGGNGSQGAPFDTLAAAEAAATPGTEILLADGLYRGPLNTDVDYGYDFTIRSISGPQNCIIDCENFTRAFRFVSGETKNARLIGVTIRNGRSSGAMGGGGILIHNSSPTIEDCVIESCYSPLDGGAVLIAGSTIGGVTTILRCTLSGNRADRHGGGLAASGSGIKLGLSSVQDNSAGDAGGGIYGWTTQFQSTWLLHTSVQGNDATRGGGIYASGNGYSRFSTCLVTGNTAATSGGGLSVKDPGTIEQCTIAQNQAGVEAGGVKVLSGSFYLYNSILWGNLPVGPQYSGSIIGGYNCFPGGTGTNVSSDPLFTNGFRLGPGSACIDAADQGKVPLDSLDLNGNGNTTEPVPFDLDLLPRFVDDPTMPNKAGIVDIGCYERQ